MLIAEVLVNGKPVAALRRDERERYWYCEGLGSLRGCESRAAGMRALEAARKLSGGTLRLPPVRVVSLEPPLPRTLLAEVVIGEAPARLVVGLLERDAECFWVTRLVGRAQPVYDYALALEDVQRIVVAFNARLEWTGLEGAA